MTEASNEFEKMATQDIKSIVTRKRSHMDGITHIDVMPQYGAYATSSYDCCVYIWSLWETKSLGALLLGSLVVIQEERNNGTSRCQRTIERRRK